MPRKDNIKEALNAATTVSSFERNARYWIAEIAAAQKKVSKWHKQGEAVLDKYLDKRGSADSNARHFNLFNANTGILQSALYARIPQPDVSRRHRDAKDQVGRVASLILQRALTYELDSDNYFDTTAKNIILDRLIAGAGCGWVRYDVETSLPESPEFQLTDDQDELSAEVSLEPVIEDESTPIDYVHWKDFLWSPARTWDEVRWVARRVYMDEAALAERFGEDIAANIPMHVEDNEDRDLKAGELTAQEAEVYEIWDKTTKTVYFVCQHCDYLLDEKEDPLGLPGFFPTAKPLFATVATSELMPIPDYVLIQDQYEELNEINNRISRITEAIRAVGVYDAKQTGLKSLLSDAAENQMIPVENWAQFAEGGSLKGAMDFLPTQPLTEVLKNLQIAREQTKAQIYELTGISDVVRGQSQQYVTAQAEAMKGQYASLRLTTLQQSVAEYFSGLIKLKAHLICKFYEPQRILERCGQLFDNDLPYVSDAIALLKNEGLRHFRVNVSVDSLQLPDWNADKQGKSEVLMAVTQFMGQVVPAVKATPELAPLALNFLRWSITGFKGAASIEGVIEDGLRDLEKAQQQAAMNPQKHQPSPEEIKLQLEQMKMQGDMQLAQAKMAADQERAKDQLALDQSRAASDAQIAQIKTQADAEKARMEIELAARKLQLEEAKLDLERQRLAAEAFHRESSKDEFTAMASQMLSEMRAMAAQITGAINTPASTGEI